MVAQGNVGVAFALVPRSTTLGAAVVFCASLARPRILAGSLGFAAGVMLYVSFAEIFMRKSVEAFQGAEFEPVVAYRWATLCFFAGMLLVFILDRIVHAIADYGMRRGSRNSSSRGAGAGASQAAIAEAAEAGSGAKVDVEAGGSAGSSSPRKGNGGRQQGCTASETLDGSPAGASADENDLAGGVGGLSEPCDALTSAVVAASCPDTVPEVEGQPRGPSEGEVVSGAPSSSRVPPAMVELMEADHHAFMLKKTGVLTALAIFIHNFPEGLATFVGALADTKIGVGLAVAIAMHNIPEGICVAMPIYYATGSRWKGFFWAFLSGVSEPVGGLIGYLVLDGDNDMSFAIVFGIVGGMMVYISLKELLPTALRYDPKDSLASTCVILGMVVMAGSLLLFTI